MLSFASGPLVLSALRRQLPDHPRPFRLPGGDVVAFLAFYGSNLIVYWTGWTTDWKLFVAVLIGFALLAVFTATGRVTSHMEWRSGATWVLPWLCGLALISYLGAYGDGLGVIGFGAAFPVIGVFSLIIFMLAVRVRLVPERAAEHVEHSRAEAEGEEHELDGAAT